MCLFISLLALGPRFAGMLWWLIDPARWSLAFNGNILVGVLGLLFLPWVAVVYVVVSPLGVEGFDWVLLALALVLDIGSWAGGAWRGRDRLPGYGTPP